mmetsp:Transcript_11087/g.12843  ORF Transcript_11087/g.12843 Transcript_11087/m.12843 type:complete len:489 (-) Transcript_11087:51-1517(-)
MECRSLPGTCSKSITLLSVAALVLSFINVQTTTASLLNCNHNPSFIVIQTPGFARSSICTSAKIKSMALHSHHDKSDHDEHHSSSIVDMAIPILNNRLHQLRKQILENQIQKPPNPLLDPVQTISSILNELQQQPLTNKATDSHGNSSHDDYDNTRTKNQNYMSFLPDSGYRTLIRASTNTWKSALRKSIGAPENVTEEQFVSALQTAMSRPNNQYQILVSDSDIDVNVETTSSHGDDDDDNDNDDTKSSEYNLGANALLGSPGFSAGAFLSSPWSNDEPDIQLTVFPQEREPHYTHRLKSQNVTNSAVMLITVALLRPEGRYEIKLADPVYDDSLHDNGSSSIDKYFEQLYKFKVPSIVPTNDNSTYLTDVDAKRIAWGIEQVRNITRFSPLSNRINDEVLPGSHINGADLIEFVKDSIMTNSHWCGSTRMGMDSNSVVDEFLRVRGVLNLRIVDAGVFPFIPNGNTHSTTCVVALRAVDLILGSQS